MAHNPYEGPMTGNLPNGLFQQQPMQMSFPKQLVVYTVDSQKEAEFAQVSGVFIDTQSSVVYKKQVDAMGRTTLFEVYDLVKREPDPDAEYITKAEVKALFEQYLGPKRQNTYNKNFKKQHNNESEEKSNG